MTPTKNYRGIMEFWQVGNRVANASWSFFARTVGNGWNTLSEAADFWANEVDAEVRCMNDS
jgi:hypothetical protein